MDVASLIESVNKGRPESHGRGEYYTALEALAGAEQRASESFEKAWGRALQTPQGQALHRGVLFGKQLAWK